MKALQKRSSGKVQVVERCINFAQKLSIRYVSITHPAFNSNQNGKVKSLACSIFFFIFFCLSGNTFSQQNYSGLEKVYGSDPLLYNGKKYDFFPPQGTLGHQYLVSNEPVIGGVTIKGITFKNIKLNYDIYNQELLLTYTDNEESSTLVQVSKAWLESFYLENRYFEKCSFEEETRFYQVLGSDTLKVLYFWKKYFELDKSFGSKNFSFSAANKNMFVLKNGVLLSFKNKRSFIAIFEPERKTAIKAFLRNSRFKFKHADDTSMAGLIDYISNL
jgi:hypothetical protein